MELKDAVVVIGDDSVLARKQLKDVLLGLGVGTVFEAANGKLAAELVAKEKPNLVFLDIVMPVMDGNSAIETILASDPDMKIVVVSSVGTQAQVKRAVEAGIKDFIQKPFNTDQIAKTVKTLIEEA